MATQKKSRSLRKVYKRIPSKTTIHYEKSKPSKAKCNKCGTQLAGTLRLRPYKMMTIAKSKKRPERKYGGFLCSPCSRSKLRLSIRERVFNKK